LIETTTNDAPKALKFEQQSNTRKPTRGVIPLVIVTPITLHQRAQALLPKDRWDQKNPKQRSDDKAVDKNTEMCEEEASAFITHRVESTET
jgi:hypothetical protein